MARIGDRFTDEAIRIDVEDVERTPFVAAARETDGDVATARTREPPVDRRQRARIERERIDERAIRPIAVANEQ